MRKADVKEEQAEVLAERRESNATASASDAPLPPDVDAPPTGSPPATSEQMTAFTGPAVLAAAVFVKILVSACTLMQFSIASVLNCHAFTFLQMERRVMTGQRPRALGSQRAHENGSG
jgi:hypothetical protein